MFWLGDAASTENQTDDIRQPAGRYGLYPVIESHEDIAASARQPGGLMDCTPPRLLLLSQGPAWRGVWMIIWCKLSVDVRVHML